MSPFLQQIAQLFLNRYGTDIHRLAFVFPNKRSELFFRKYLSETASMPLFSPTILTISELFRKLNPKLAADPVKLLFLLYDIYIRRSGQSETFDNFVYWGKMLLNDFDEVDKYLIDAKQLFTNITDLNAIEKDFSFLNPSQTQAIRTFWSSFQPESEDSNKAFFLRVWELLFPVYTELRETLTAEGLAYEGMIYREVIEKLSITSEDIRLPYEKIVFVGLNALTPAERELMKHLKKKGIADFYWDYSSEKINDTDNRASFFVEENIRSFPSEFSLPAETPSDTQFELIAVPSRIGQAKQIYQILNNLEVTAEDAFNTAVVLPDEQLLLPVLHSIPEQFGYINITLGYPLSGTPIASLMDILQSLQKNAKDMQFFHSDVIALLRHQFVLQECPDEATAIMHAISERNQVYVSMKDLQGTPLLSLLFSAPSNVLDLSDYLITVLTAMGAEGHTVSPFEAVSADRQGGRGMSGMLKSAQAMELEYVYHYYKIINRMRELIREMQTEMTSDTFFNLLKQITDLIRLPFWGEPLSGLQVMGALETQLLDFDNLIILSVNEGIFPANKTALSFIPYHIRRGFGLPTPEHQDSIWAYHFYRMVYRAKRVIMLYDTRTDGLQSGEVSRFVHQLRYHYKTPIQQKTTVYNVATSKVTPFIVEKDEETMRLLALYETDKSLSASAINTYLDCPVKFYFAAIKGIDEEKAISETLRYDLFGTLLHRVMELTYKPFNGKTVTADLLRLASQENNMTDLIQRAFAKDYFHAEEPQPLTGQVYLYGEIIRKYACKIIEYDRSLTPFRYIASEIRFNRTLTLNNGRSIRIKGFIDRIDTLNEVVRIVDYKSGRPEALTFSTIESLFDPSEKDRKKAIFQVFLYAWAYASETGIKQIQPSIYYAMNLFKQNNFNSAILQIVEKETMTTRIESVYTAFEKSLRDCLDELFDVDTPFTRTSFAKNCEYCPFKKICGK